MTRPRIRAVFDSLPSYQPDQAVLPVAGHVCALGANESPHAVLPDIAAAIVAAATTVNRYPDFGATELIAEIARAHGVAEDQVALGAGSVALLQMALQAIAEPDAEVLYAWRSFELYPVLAHLAGARSVRVPLVDEAHDLPAMADEITGHTRMIIICNPDNPTGTVLGHAELREFLSLVPPDCLVVLDEAYGEYVRGGPGPCGGLGLCQDWPTWSCCARFPRRTGSPGSEPGT